MIDWKALGKGAVRVTLTAVLSFLGMLGAMTVMGVVLAALSGYFLWDLGWIWGTVGAAVAVIECVVLGFFVGGKRAIAMATVKALSQLRLGRAAVRLLFDRILKIQAEEPVGDRGNVVVRTVERLPLAQAQRYAEQGITSLVKAPTEGGGVTGWVRRLIQRQVLWAVGMATLTSFREEAAAKGGVDLKLVQADLEERIDHLIARKVKKGINLLTALVLIGVPLQALITIVLLRYFFAE